MGLQFQITLDTVARDPKPPPTPEEKQYQLHIPQWDDVIHIIPESFRSPEEQERRKRERIQRMKNSPSPQIAQMIGQIATYIDDAEDLLSTFLLLGRPLIRKLGPRAVPYLGMILTAVDIAEATVLLSGVAPSGQHGKRNTIDVVSSLSLKQGARLRRVERWMRMRPGAGALVEGLQAMDTLTGFGLSYGPVIGFAEDTIFAAGREALGQDTRLMLPSAKNQKLLAAKMLVGAGMLIFLPFVMNPIGALAIWLAYEIASDVILEAIHPAVVEDRFGEICSMGPPQMLPTNELTRTLLQREGIDPDRKEPPPLLETIRDPTIRMLTEAMTTAIPAGLLSWKHTLGRTPEGTFAAMGAVDLTRKWWSWLEEQENNLVFSPNMADKIMLNMIESGTDVRRNWFLEPVPKLPDWAYQSYIILPPMTPGNDTTYWKHIIPPWRAYDPPPLRPTDEVFDWIMAKWPAWTKTQAHQAWDTAHKLFLRYYHHPPFNTSFMLRWWRELFPGLDGLDRQSYPWLICEIYLGYHPGRFPPSASNEEVVVWMVMVAQRTYLDAGATDEALTRLYSAWPNAELLSTVEDDPQPIGTAAVLYADLGFKHTPTPKTQVMLDLADAIWSCHTPPKEWTP